MKSLTTNSSQVIVFAVGNSVYNLVFHPLRKYPGPLLFRATRLAWIRRLLAGSLAQEVLKMTDTYGPVVRIAPNELAFIEPQAWKDIYGHRSGSLSGEEQMSKYRKFYNTIGRPRSIINETDDNHALLRRQLAPGFSEKAMREQEPIIGGYVDLLIKRLKERCGVAADGEEQPLDLRTWYNWTTFDVIGDLAFGEPFGCLEKADYHPSVKAIVGTLRTGAWMTSAKYLGLDGLLVRTMIYLSKSRKTFSSDTRAKLTRRMAIDVERPDLIESLLKRKDEWVSRYALLLR